jgi:hypothetical protein
MSKIIKLPSGNTATWKDPQDYTLKDRKYALKDVRREDLNNLTNMLDVLERVVIVSVTEWSFDLIPPNIKPESLEHELVKLPDVDALLREARESMQHIMPDLVEPEDGEVADPKADTPNSDA